jgi:NADH-quinone oxidoreductase subunit N
MNLDLSVPSQLLLAFAPDIVIVVGAMVVLLASVWSPVRGDNVGATRVTSVSAIVVCVLALVAVIWMAVSGAHSTGGVIAVDRFRWVMDGIILVSAIMTLALAMDHDPLARITAREAPVLVLLAVSGMMLLSAARDLILVFLGIELMSVAVYVLAALDRRSARSSEAGLKYFLLGAFSSAFLLYGIALIYGATGSTNLLVIGSAMASAAMQDSVMLFVGMALLLVGFAFKVSSVPFHMWTPDVYDGTPTPYAGFMAAAVKAASFAALVRVVLEGSAGSVERWHTAVWWLAALTMIIGNLVAVQQRNIKRLLAYSSIAHAGFLLVAVASQTAAGGAAILFYLVAYTLATIGAFAVVVALSDGSDGPTDVSRYAGLFSVQPRIAMAMAVFMLALLGFPLAGGMGFFAKWYVLQAALQAPEPQTRLAVLLVLMTVVSASFYLYVIMVMFMGSRDESSPPLPTPPKVTSGIILASAILILLLGLNPTPAVRIARASTIGTIAAPATPPATTPAARTAGVR